ncbi:MAG: hypothetical protein ACRD0A_06735 [Acidimicrobiales bacterium]
MPSIWDDVSFDEASAVDVKEELIAAARALGEATAVLMEDIPVVTEDWRGRFREVFDPEAVRLLGSLAMVSESLMATAVDVAATLEDAKAEQARRQWLRELALEEASADDSCPAEWDPSQSYGGPR